MKKILNLLLRKVATELFLNTEMLHYDQNKHGEDSKHNSCPEYSQ